MDWLLTREAVIALAIMGAVPSALAALLQSRGSLSAHRARQLNIAGYGFMGASMLLFITIGFRA
jgi:membrane protein required for beta-lactamase induction